MEIRGIRGRRIWCGIGCADVGWDVGAGAASCNFNFIDRTDARKGERGGLRRFPTAGALLLLYPNDAQNISGGRGHTRARARARGLEPVSPASKVLVLMRGESQDSDGVHGERERRLVTKRTVLTKMRHYSNHAPLTANIHCNPRAQPNRMPPNSISQINGS